MSLHRLKTTFRAALLGGAACLVGLSVAPTAAQAADYKRITALAFGPDGTLYFGDSGTGKLHSLTPPKSTNTQAKAAYNLDAVDSLVAAKLGTSAANVRVRDMVIHPKTKEAYLAVGRVTGKSYASALVVVNQSGAVRMLDLAKAKVKSVQIPFSPAKDFKIYRTVPARDLSITDIEVYKKKVYVAGLSNADFQSSLWTISANLRGKVTTTRTEIYHAIHGQNETRAPIRSMKIMNIGGTDTVLAAYTCTPLVTFPLSSLKDGAKVKGKTIGELGFGNTPGDIISFTAQAGKDKTYPVVFIQNKNQSAQVIPLAGIQKAMGEPGLSKPLQLKKVVLGGMDVPMAGLMQVDDQDGFRLAAVRRDAESGQLQMVSYMKNVYFRLSDFESEYDMPNFKYPKGADMIKGFQNKMRMDEGFPENVVK